MQKDPFALPKRTSPKQLLSRMRRGQTFWEAVHAPYIDHEICRADVIEVIQNGLLHTCGSYKKLVVRFRMEPGDYKFFMNFLRKHHCLVPFLPYREKFRA